MDFTNQIISPACKRRLQVQGYVNHSDQELASYRFGIRFAYWLCTTLVVAGLLSGTLWFLIAAAVIAFIAVFPPYHPFDYLYNYGVRFVVGKPKLPHRTRQGRFACGMASVWLVATLYLLSHGQALAGNVLGWLLVAVAVLVSATDICIPSMIYNALFLKSKTQNTVESVKLK